MRALFVGERKLFLPVLDLLYPLAKIRLFEIGLVHELDHPTHGMGDISRNGVMHNFVLVVLRRIYVNMDNFSLWCKLGYVSSDAIVKSDTEGE